MYCEVILFSVVQKAAEQIIISDDEEAVIRSAQMEEDEALARNLQVGNLTCSVQHKHLTCAEWTEWKCFWSFRPSLTERRPSRTAYISATVIIFNSCSRTIRGWETLMFTWRLKWTFTECFPSTFTCIIWFLHSFRLYHHSKKRR